MAETLLAFAHGGFGLLALADIGKHPEQSHLDAMVVAHGHAGNADPQRRSIHTAEPKIEGSAVAGQRAKKITLRGGQILRKDACEARLLGHGFEARTQNFGHAPVAEDGTTFRIDDPYAFWYGLYEPT